MTFPLLALSGILIAGVTVAGAAFTRRYFAFGFLGATLLLAIHGRIYVNYLSDDGYIDFRSARNLADGHGPVWNLDGTRVEGYMSILWVGMLAGAAKIGLSIPETGRYLGFAFGAGALAMLFPLARALPGGDRHPLAPVLAALLLAAAGPFALWTFAGMELPLLLLLALVAIWLHLREDAAEPFVIPWSGIFFALAAMARPEAGIFAAITAVFKLVRLRETPARRSRLIQFLVWCGVIVLLYGAYFAWRYDYYGYLLPNTFYAKVGSGRDMANRGIHYLASRGDEYGGLLLAAGIAAFLAQARPLRTALYAVSLILAWIVWMPFSGGDTLLRGRFLAPVLPLLYLVAVLGAALILEAAKPQANRSLALPAFGALFVIVLLGTLYPSLDPAIIAERRGMADRVTIGRWMASELPPDTLVGVTPAGAIPYYSRLPTLDMLGLNDTEIAHHPVADFGKGFAGHEKFDIDYVLERRPQVIFLGNALAEIPFLTVTDYMTTPWNMPDEYYLIQDQRTFFIYQPVAVPMDDGRWLNLLVDRQAKSILAGLGQQQASLSQ